MDSEQTWSTTHAIVSLIDNLQLILGQPHSASPMSGHNIIYMMVIMVVFSAFLISPPSNTVSSALSSAF